MGLYSFHYSYFLYMLPALVLSVAAQIWVHSSFQKYSRVGNAKGITGEEAAWQVLHFGGVMGVRVQPIAGNLTDHFNPSTKIIGLSQPVYGQASIAAVGVAAHEAGHAVQHARGYLPIKIRTALVPAVNIGSRFSIPLIMLGLLLPVQYTVVVYIGMGLYGLAVLFSLVTLPVEFNASRRALQALRETRTLSPVELSDARKVLTAAAMTYVASTLTALLSLVRLASIIHARRGR